MTITYSKPDHKIKTILPGDEGWFMRHDNMTLTPRAGIQITDACPYSYKLIMAQAFDEGWIKPIAYVKESDYAWEQLQK